MAAPASILTINSGSSSVRFAVYTMGEGETLRFRGHAERIGLESGGFQVAGRNGQSLVEERRAFPDHGAALERILAFLRDSHMALDAVGHRVVQGGSRNLHPTLVTPELLAELRDLVSYLPDHLPHQIEALEALRNWAPALPHVACFDTAFHRTMPRVAQLYALPRKLWDEGLLRYGFHGLSYEYVIRQLAMEADSRVAQGRVIIAHLGNGASMAAARACRCVETTMGFTPTGGLMMSSRSGDLDPEVILYLLQRKRLAPAQVSRIVNRHSGLLGVSGTSSDMRDLLAREKEDGKAAEAIELFCYSAKKFIGALAAVLGGLDALVFTGGIGENAPAIRARICAGLEHLGLRMDLQANEAHGRLISVADSPAEIRVIPTNEDLMIARHTSEVIRP